MVLLHGLAVLAAKITSASTVVQATAGLGIAVAGVTGAGAAGVLPGALQDGVAGAVQAVSPFDLPDSADGRTPLAGETVDSGTDGPGDVPVADPTAAPESTPSSIPSAETTHSPEPGDDGGIHQHRGGESAPTGAVPTEDSVSDDTSGRDHPEDDGASAGPTASPHSAEAEDHDDDNSGQGGDDDGGDDNSGHGGGTTARTTTTRGTAAGTTTDRIGPTRTAGRGQPGTAGAAHRAASLRRARRSTFPAGVRGIWPTTWTARSRL